MDPEEYSGVNIEVAVSPSISTVAIPIKMHAELLVEGRPIRSRTETMYLHCLTSGGVLITPFDEKRRLQVHTETLHFSINLTKGAHIDHFSNRLTGRKHLRSCSRDSIGPPFWPSEQLRTHFNHRIEQPGDGTTHIITWMNCQRYPGLIFSKIFILTGNSSSLEIVYNFENKNSQRTYNVKIMMGSIPGVWDHLHVLPLKNGLLREEFIEDEFFASGRELPKKREDWAETWYCAERPHRGEVTALLCHPSIFHEASGRTFIDFQLQVPPLTPMKKVSLPPVYLVSGFGTWQTIRNLWYQNYPDQPDRMLPEFDSKGAIDVQTIKYPFLQEVSSQFNIPIQVRHLIHRPIHGILRFTAPKGWHITPRTKRFRDLKRDTPLIVPLKLTVKQKEKQKPEILSVHARIKTNLREYEFQLPIILHRQSGTVSVSKTDEKTHEIYIIDNGTYQLKIAPDFAGCIYGWINKQTGTNYLKSSFPTAGPMVWFNPWYGGIRFDPFPPDRPGWFPTKLDRESWSTREIQRNQWQGVALSVKPDKEEPKLKGFQLELQVLTQPKSNIVALIGRAINRSQAPRQIHHRLRVSLPSDTSLPKLETITPRSTTTYRRRRVRTHAWPSTTHSFLGVEHAKDDATILFIHKQGPKGELYQGDLNPELIQFNNEELLDVKARSTVERISYLVITNLPWNQAREYAVLANHSFEN